MGSALPMDWAAAVSPYWMPIRVMGIRISLTCSQAWASMASGLRLICSDCPVISGEARCTLAAQQHTSFTPTWSGGSAGASCEAEAFMALTMFSMEV